LMLKQLRGPVRKNARGHGVPAELGPAAYPRDEREPRRARLHRCGHGPVKPPQRARPRATGRKTGHLHMQHRSRS